MAYNDLALDVICQVCKDGTVIPMKIRLQDEDGEYQEYRINSYKELIKGSGHNLPDGTPIGNNIISYECKIVVFGREKKIYLYCNLLDRKWICRA